MEQELNVLEYDNAKVTFTGQTDNIATSDELEAAPVYQDKMGTAYSRSKKLSRAISATGISLLLTAAAIRTGSLIANAFILNPPSISAKPYTVTEHVFNYEFTVSNKGKYTINYFLEINANKVITGDCSEERTYSGSYEGVNKGDKLHFYIQFTNGVDYTKIIENYKYTVEE